MLLAILRRKVCLAVLLPVTLTLQFTITVWNGHYLQHKPISQPTWHKSQNILCPSGSPCKEHLSRFDRNLYDKCYQKVKDILGANMTINDNGCKFRPNYESTDNTIALASFPGSGNTWIRVMLEQSTGICTGSYYCDMSLRYKGFSGENIRGGNVLVVKTHAFPVWEVRKNGPKLDSAIVIIRNPFDALVAEWNRKVANGFNHMTVKLGTHVAKARETYFGNNIEWTRYVLDQSKRWRQMIEHWVIDGLQRKRKILVVQYEDIKKNKLEAIAKMLNLLGVNYTLNDLRNKLQEHALEQFHRNHTTTGELDPFTRGQSAIVNRMLRETQLMLQRSGIQHGVEDVVKLYSRQTTSALVKTNLTTY